MVIKDITLQIMMKTICDVFRTQTDDHDDAMMIVMMVIMFMMMFIIYHYDGENVMLILGSSPRYHHAYRSTNKLRRILCTASIFYHYKRS